MPRATISPPTGSNRRSGLKPPRYCRPCPRRPTHAQLAAGDAFHQAIAALFTAIDSVDSTELDALSYAGDRVVAEIAHTGNADLDTVRAALADAGLPSEVTGSRTTGNRVHSMIELGAAP